MILTSFSYYVKQNHFEFFYYFHFAMSIFICIACALHSAGFMCVAYAVWTSDVILRYFLTLNKLPVVARCLDADVIRFTLPKSFEYKAGQYCFICIPEMDRYQYHPFSISSAPYEEVVSFHIRALGTYYYICVIIMYLLIILCIYNYIFINIIIIYYVLGNWTKWLRNHVKTEALKNGTVLYLN
jgi:predicted ferric reductase